MSRLSFKKSVLAAVVAASMGSAVALADVYTPGGVVNDSNVASGTTVIGGGTVTTSSTSTSPGNGLNPSLYYTGAFTGYTVAGGTTATIEYEQSTSPSATTFDSNGVHISGGQQTTSARAYVTALQFDNGAGTSVPVVLEVQTAVNPDFDPSLPIGPGNEAVIVVTDDFGNPVPVGAPDTTGVTSGAGLTAYADVPSLQAAVPVAPVGSPVSTGGADLEVDGNTTIHGTLTVGGSQVATVADVAQEAADRTAADAALDGRITQEVTDRTNADAALDGRITSEVTRLDTEDNRLQGEITAESTRAQNAEAGLRTDLNTEISARQLADQQLSADIADTELRLQANIDAEARQRAWGDAILHNRIDELDERLSSGIASAVAMANIPQVGEGQRFSIGIGAGHYNSENSLAIGSSFRIGERTVLKGSVATGLSSGSRDTAVGLGIGFSW